MTAVIVSIVEGQSEVKSVPILLRRILAELEIYHIQPARPWRVGRCKIVRKGELERVVEQSLRRQQNSAGLLVLLDADEDCPAQLGPHLLQRCRKIAPVPTAVVIAKAEFESWFLGAKESLRGFRGIRSDATAPENPEEVSDAKARVSRNMEGKRRYVSTSDQPALAQQMDLDQARANCPSFEKFYREIQNLVSAMPDT